jgi:hypothetical protein
MADLKLNTKYNRSNFIPKIFNDVDGIEELALSDSNWDRYFQTKYPTKEHELIQAELNRPDLLSFNIYGRADYWWILLKFNNIMDPFTELNRPGLVMRYPNIKDIQDFYMNVKNKRRVAGGTGRTS